MNMYEFISRGGPVMWVLLAISIFAIVIFLKRLFHYHRSQINSQDFLDGIYNVLKRGNTVEAITICEDTPGPVAQIARAAILKAEDSPEEISLAIQHAGLIELPRIEHHLVVLATLVKITPYVGLAGTVFGMMDTLAQLHLNAPLAHAGDLAGGLWQALMTTAAALCIVIPAYTGYNFLVSRAESLVLDMEKASADIFTYLVEIQKNRAAREAP
jgi:biopolymer transport protein ExbB